jgi:hypothetical protein
MPIRPARRRLAAGPVVALASASLLSACLSSDGFDTNNRYGSITIESNGSANGRVLATAVGSFFRGGEIELPSSRVTSDNCGTFNLITETFTPGNLDAGGDVQLQVAGASYALSESAQVPLLYSLSNGGTFSYAPGDTARLAVPGSAGGFPAAQVAVRLAEPVQLGTVTDGEINEDLPVSWATNGDANSSIIISLRYTTSLTSTVPDVQVLCIVRDNGAYAIPASFLGNYYSANPESRSLNVLRWRTSTSEVDERTALYVVSTADTTVALIP